MKLKVPPVALVVICAIAMWLIEKQFQFLDFSFEYQPAIAAALSLLGIIIGGVAISDFIKAKTTVNPTAPASANTLVIKSLYRYSRNPMYLGMLLILSGWSVWLGSAAALPVLIFFVWYMNEFQIKPEEQALTEKFGAEYQAYCKKVRRWI